MHLSTPLVAWKSQQGTRGKGNDDHYGWFAVERSDLRRTVYIALVADGVTSTEGGAQASRIAVEAVRAALSERPDPRETISEWLAHAVLHANEEILFEAKRNPQWKGMSTTLVLSALAGDKLYVMHLGDSRAYLVRSNRLYQLTTDHTWAQEAFDAGTISAEEAERHPGRNQLQRFLGAQHAVNVARGVIAPGSGYVEEYLLLQPGDVLLLCTDGIYRRLPADEIKQVVVDYTGNPQDTVDTLVAAAAANGEADDITALVVEVPPGRQPLGETTWTAAHTPFTLEEPPVQANNATSVSFLLLSGVVVLAIIVLYWLLTMH
jgi:serine/threonine protein phosphatase PrpC